MAAFLRDLRPARVVAVMAVMCFYVGLLAVGADSSFTSSATDGSLGARDGLSGDAPRGDGAVGESGGTSSDSGELVVPDGTTRGSGGSSSSGSGGGGGAGTGGQSTGTPGEGEPIQIGVHDDDPGAAFSQFGVQGGPTGNQGEWIQAIVDWINDNGGMGGRQVELVHHITESLNGSFDQQAEQACTYFTEDNDVVAVVGGARVPTLNLVDCLARHDTPLVWSYQYMADRATFEKYANHLYMPAMVNADRLGVWMDAIGDRGFFDGGKVGIVRFDDEISRHLTEDVLRPRLAARGVTVAREIAFRGATGASSAADLSAQANNAILRFRSEGINRVIFAPTSAVVPLLFLKVADGQGFRPRYTMTTYDVPSFQDANAPAAQLQGSLAFGWTPAGDVEWLQQPQPLSPAAQRCLDITAKAEPTGNGSVRRFCDGLFFLKYLFDHGAQPTTAGIRAAVDALGSSYPSAWTFTSTMSSRRHDGVSVGRVLAFDGGCECYMYVGGDIPIP